MTIAPNATLYEAMSVDITCNVTVSGVIDTPFSITREWFGPMLITAGADYNISGNTLSIKQLVRLRDNARFITCISKIFPMSDYVLQSNNVSSNITLSVEGKCMLVV